MAEKRTYVKRITVGRPVKSINEAASGVVIGSGRIAGDILVNKSSTNLFEPGSLVAGHGLDKSYGDSNSNNIVMSIDSSELKEIIDSDYIKFMTGQATTRNFVDSAYVEANSLDSERGLNLFRNDLAALTTSIVPDVDSAIDLGSQTKKFRKLFLSGNTIKLGTLNISDSGGIFVVRDSDNNNTKLDLSANSTNDLLESDNLYYTRARFDSALGDTTSKGTIRGYINLAGAPAGDGSLTYDSGSGQLTYTGPSPAEVRAHFLAVDSGGDGAFSYEQATGKFIYRGPSATEVRKHLNIVDAGGDGSLAYDSALGKLTYTGPSATEVRRHFNTAIASGDGFLAYDSALGKFTYTGPSADSIRSHFSAAGDLTYNSGTGEFSFNVETVYTQANFESDLSLSLNATNGIAYDSAKHKLSLINTGVDSAIYGSSTRVPILTVNAQGRIDSAGSVLVAGVTGVTFDSATEKLTISTADGGSFSTAIGGYDNLQATTFTGTNAAIDSAVISFISGGHANYDSAHISQLLVDSGRFTVLTSPNITADSAIANNISGNNLNYGIGRIGQFNADSAETVNLRVSGSLIVAGSQSIINTEVFKVTDPLIHLADSNVISDIIDIGFIGKYYADAQQRHTGLVRDASAGQYYLFDNSIDSASDSVNTINLGATGFRKAWLNVGNIIADSATMTNLTVTGLASTTLARTATVDSGTYGSATRVPILTVNTSGFIDSIGEVLVAGVTGLTYDSNTESITISTADGGSFATHIGGFKNIDVDSANIFNIAGSNIHYDSGFIGQFSTDSAHISQLNTTVVRAGGILADSGDYTVLKIGGAHVNTEMFTDSAFVLARIEALSLDSERTINLIRNDNLFVDSAYIEQVSLDSERAVNLIDSNYINERSHQLTRDEFSFTLTNAGSAAGPRIVLDRNSSSAADSDALAMIEFRGRNDADSNITYAKIENFINDASADSEDGELHFTIKQSGILRTKMKMTPTGIVLAGNERIMFSDDSFQQALIPGDYTSNHGLTLPDSTGTLLTREFVSNIIDSDYIGLRASSTGFTLDFADSAGATKVSLVILQAATIATGAVIGFGNTVTLLDTDSAAVTISL
jgi:hypothetical protein|tara:strand:- start:11486 stop:14773 length:3288 start_codon:yes stop_codon:yes gene_type:complete